MTEESASPWPPFGGDGVPPGDGRFVVLPLPFERTVSYGHGTAGGPRAILEASAQVELYDERLGNDPSVNGIRTLPPFLPESSDLGAAIEEIRQHVRPLFAAGQVPLILGGEHSLTTGPVRAAHDELGEIGVVQFDAHGDLRDRYEGSPWSHACVLRRIHEDGIPTLGIGLRAIAEEEGQLIADAGLRRVWGWQLPDYGPEELAADLQALPRRIYLSFDIDYFDPSLVPATGTPEPGGGAWWPTLDLLERLFREREVVGMDLVELAPVPGQPASDFVAARLAYKMFGFWADTGAAPGA